MTLDTRFGSPGDRLLVALLVALVLHAAILFGVRFRLPTPPPVRRTLDIELVSEVDGRRPEKADYLASHSSDGGAREQARRPQPPPQSRPRGVPQPPPPTHLRPRRVLTRQAAPQAVTQAPRPQPQPSHRLDPGLLARQIAELDVRPRRSLRFAGERVTPIERIRAHKYVAAAYERAWQEKVERVGKLNYPDEARRKGLSGKLLVSVWVAKDGTVKKIKIRRSSGYKILDAAAVRIVRLASPFAPFPKELAQQTDVLVITRTWRFFNDNGLAMGR
ncbi:periplasmic protein TonB [Methylomarinovum caldicuralii]|uniref:Periplasmic protein TonB n=1 Tax=Methylomarinovum caldicuralii TaxID=438856 RepID=A0AAU9BS83_9GAMM|nr:energy transducer TonB [Methylomarinovum caldicuralii]BCX81386.1 periplasmic protein TonB [Methylomarinovum caldicuralii]